MFREEIKYPKWFLRKVEIKESPIHGLGVFATEAISKYEMIESCPVVIFHKTIIDDFYKYNDASGHILDDYVFTWPKGFLAIALGYGSIYNHSNDYSNAGYGCMHEKDVYGLSVPEDYPRIEFVAKRDIEAGEEILIHYRGGHYNLDFDDAGTVIPVEKLNMKDRGPDER